MVSSMFKKDYEAMTAAGVKFMPEDIIRLNALALKAKLATKPFAAAHIRRAVFLDNGGIFRRPLVLREPTIAHLMWLEEMQSFSGRLDDLAWYAVCAFALSRDADTLPPPIFHTVVSAAVARFARRLRRLTKSQLCDAVDFAISGSDWTSGERLTQSADHSERDASELDDDSESFAIGAIVGSVAHRLPLSLDDVKSLTESELLQMMLEAKIGDDKYSVDAERNRALGNYFRARDEIKRRAPEWQS